MNNDHAMTKRAKLRDLAPFDADELLAFAQLYFDCDVDDVGDIDVVCPDGLARLFATAAFGVKTTSVKTKTVREPIAPYRSPYPIPLPPPRKE